MKTFHSYYLVRDDQIGKSLIKNEQVHRKFIESNLGWNEITKKQLLNIKYTQKWSKYYYFSKKTSQMFQLLVIFQKIRIVEKKLISNNNGELNRNLTKNWTTRISPTQIILVNLNENDLEMYSKKINQNFHYDFRSSALLSFFCKCKSSHIDSTTMKIQKSDCLPVCLADSTD